MFVLKFTTDSRGNSQKVFFPSSLFARQESSLYHSSEAWDFLKNLSPSMFVWTNMFNICWMKLIFSLIQLYNKLGYSVGSVHPRALWFHSQNVKLVSSFFSSTRLETRYSMPKPLLLVWINLCESVNILHSEFLSVCRGRIYYSRTHEITVFSTARAVELLFLSLFLMTRWAHERFSFSVSSGTHRRTRIIW